MQDAGPTKYASRERLWRACEDSFQNDSPAQACLRKPLSGADGPRRPERVGGGGEGTGRGFRAQAGRFSLPGLETPLIPIKP